MPPCACGVYGRSTLNEKFSRGWTLTWPIDPSLLPDIFRRNPSRSALRGQSMPLLARNHSRRTFGFCCRHFSKKGSKRNNRTCMWPGAHAPSNRPNKSQDKFVGRLGRCMTGRWYFAELLHYHGKRMNVTIVSMRFFCDRARTMLTGLPVSFDTHVHACHLTSSR